MKILVFIKRVPDTGIPIRVKPDGSDIVREESLTYVTNPYDEYAVEEALRIREKLGEGEIVAASLGDDSARDVLKNALALGVDRAVLLRTENPDRVDGFATAKVLADFAFNEGFNLILTGKEAADMSDSQVPSYVASLLGIPQASYAIGLEVNPPSLVVKRETDYGVETLELIMPALITCEKGLNEPRLPTLRGIMAARKKEIEVVPAYVPASNHELLLLSPPPPREQGRILDVPVEEAVRELIRLLKEEQGIL